MKYIIRLFVALVIFLGIGFLIFFLVSDNSKFYVNKYSDQIFAENIKTYEKAEELCSSINSKFLENLKVYDSYKESADYLTNYLSAITITKSERADIKKVFSTFNKNYQNFKTSLNSINDYLNETNKSETELNGRKDRVCQDFVTLNLSFNDVNLVLEKIVVDSIFDGNYLDPSLSINSCKNLIMRLYLLHNSKYSFASNIMQKNTELKNSNYKVCSDAVSFAINYNNFKDTILTDFDKYFTSDFRSENLNILLTFLESEVYYEKN